MANLLVVLLTIAVVTPALADTFFLGRKELPPPVARKDAGRVQAGWFGQKQDHFAGSTSTWQQRFFKSMTYYKDGGPAFLFISGESDASPSWLQGGQMMDLAYQYGAAAFMLEHRYYGMSHPTWNMSVDNLHYLQVEQALADLAYFIEAMKAAEGGQLASSRWIVFGGSYAGNLAAWVRLQYPQLVHGAVASSAPVLAKVNFKEYYEVVADAVRNRDLQCYQDLQSATTELSNLLTTPEGVQYASQLMQLCKPLDTTKVDDVSTVFLWLTGEFFSTTQYNSYNGDSLGKLCARMRSSSGSTPLERLVSLARGGSGGQCIQVDFEATINYLKQETWQTGYNMRQWTYQTCTQFGYYQTSDSDQQPFGHSVPLRYFIDMCKGAFGARFNEQLVEQGVRTTNIEYGGLNPPIMKVVFVHGTVDPWHALGVLKDIPGGAHAILIQGTSHCEDMYGRSNYDPPQMTEAKDRIASLVGQWIAE